VHDEYTLPQLNSLVFQPSVKRTGPTGFIGRRPMRFAWKQKLSKWMAFHQTLQNGGGRSCCSGGRCRFIYTVWIRVGSRAWNVAESGIPSAGSSAFRQLCQARKVRGSDDGSVGDRKNAAS